MHNKQTKKRTIDEVGSFIAHIVQNNKKAFRLLFINAILSFLLMCVCLYFVFLKEDKVIVLSPEGRPDIVTPINDRIFANEVQSYIGVVTSTVFGVSYIDFINQENMYNLYNSMKPFFHQEIFKSFWDSYVSSFFIKSLRENKLIVKVKPLPFDIKVSSDGKTVLAVGMIDLLNFTADGNSTVTRKKIEMKFYRGKRTIANPYGLYTVHLTEISF